MIIQEIKYSFSFVARVLYAFSAASLLVKVGVDSRPLFIKHIHPSNMSMVSILYISHSFVFI